ncbi:MAG: hypothetical protein ACLSG8_04790 [Barnesiella sp.]
MYLSSPEANRKGKIQPITFIPTDADMTEGCTLWLSHKTKEKEK